jgi:Ca2+-binding EF-hand superfamily protein
MKKIFDTFDKNGDGFITKLELKESLKNIRITVTDIEVEEIVARVDENGDGLIDFEEFVTLCEGFEKAGGGEFYRPVGVHDDDDDEDLREAFDVFDKDKDGLICVEELDLVLCSLGLGKMKIDDCREMIRKVDVDGDGMVNFDEFKLMMTSNVLVSS